jgi:hypothetical protein
MVFVAKIQLLVHVRTPLYVPGHQVSLGHDIGFDTQGIHQPKANVVSHEVSLPPHGSSKHIDTIYTIMEFVHTREGVSSSAAH